MKYNRIYIFGGTASGKTTLANKISAKLKIPVYSTDDLVYKQKWIKKYSEKEMNKKIQGILKLKKWIVEGVHRDIWINPIVSRADLVLIISLSKYKLIMRLLKREIKNKISGKTKNFSIKDILILMKYAWIYKNNAFMDHKNRAKEFNKKFITLKNNNQINNFLQTIK